LAAALCKTLHTPLREVLALKIDDAIAWQEAAAKLYSPEDELDG
jgi:hypothetical protein